METPSFSEHFDLLPVIRKSGLGRAEACLQRILEKGDEMVRVMGTEKGFPGIDTGLNVSRPAPRRPGKTIAVDIGGSHCRVVLREVAGDGAAEYFVLSDKWYKPERSEMPFDPRRKALPQLFEWILNNAAEGAEKIERERKLPGGSLLSGVDGFACILSEAAEKIPAPGGVEGNSLRASNVETHWVKGQTWVVKERHPETGVVPLEDGDDAGLALYEAALRRGMRPGGIIFGNDTALVGLAVNQDQAPHGIAGAQVTSTGTNASATKFIDDPQAGRVLRLFNLECGGGFPMEEAWLSDAEIQYNRMLNEIDPPERVTIETCTSFEFMSALLGVNLKYMAANDPGLKPLDDALEGAGADFFSTFDLEALVEAEAYDGNYEKTIRGLEARLGKRQFVQAAKQVAQAVVHRGAVLAAVVSFWSAFYQRENLELDELAVALDSSSAHFMPAFRAQHQDQFSGLCRQSGKKGRILLLEALGNERKITVPIQGAFGALDSLRA